MPKLEETQLPGVGVRVEFKTADGRRVGVIHHRTGRRDLFVCTPDDPDRVEVNLTLTDDEGHALADALGGSTIVEKLADLEHQVEGLAIDWLTVEEGSPYAGKTIGDAHVRSRTGVSVVAVIQGDDANPAPGPEFELNAGDTLVVVGTSTGIGSARALLTAD